jgi:hypothetical protein
MLIIATELVVDPIGMPNPQNAPRTRQPTQRVLTQKLPFRRIAQLNALVCED